MLRMSVRNRTVLLRAVAGVIACAAGAAAQRDVTRGAVRASIDSILNSAEYRTAHWGVLIVDPERNDTIYSHNAHRLFVPASNHKILIAAAALAELGPEFRFTTRVAALGTVTDSTLTGDLVIVGTGDPSFSDEIRGDATAGLRDMADSIRARGITLVDGRLRRTAGLFPDAPLGFGWAWDDLTQPYAATIGELMYNESFSGARVVLDGTLDFEPARTSFRNFLEAFNAVLYKRGVNVRMSYDWLFPVPDSGLRTLFTYESPPLRELLPHFMKPSQNQIGEVLLKTIARLRTGVGTADSGAAVVTRRLRQWGADSMGFIVRDGSGLSRHDFVSPETIMRVLDVMRRDSLFTIFHESFPLAGREGTLEKRFVGTRAQDNARAKTGSMDRVRTLSGFVTTADGRKLMFSLMANAYAVPGAAADAAMDAIVVRLANMRTDS